MKTILIAILAGIVLIGTPIGLVSAPANYTCGANCADDDEGDVTEAVPGWVDCDINFDCMRLL
jgi:hypothetical protein